jgi:hypothetical protein
VTVLLTLLVVPFLQGLFKKNSVTVISERTEVRKRMSRARRSVLVDITENLNYPQFKC